MKRPLPRNSASQVTPRGVVLGTLGGAFLVVGLWRVDGVLAALGLAGFCLLVLARLMGAWNLHGLEVSLQGPAKVHAGAMFPLSVVLRNRRRVTDAFGVRLELDLAGKSRIGGRAAWVAAGSAADFELRAAVPERGHAKRHWLRLSSEFPLGLFERRSVGEIEYALLVFPKPVVPRELRVAGVVADASPFAGTSTGDAAGEPRGLRPWRGGDSPRRIAWAATMRSHARGAGLLVKESDPPGFQPLRCLVLFHSFGSDGSLIRPDRFERALSLASGTLRQLHAAGLPARLIADFDGWKEHPAGTRGQLAACQEALAGAARAAGTEAHDVQAAAARAGDEESLIVLSDMPAAAWRTTIPPTRRLALLAVDILNYDGTRRKTR